MGVTQLWQILAPVEQHRTLSSLAGQTLAVDLSIWVCENQCVKQMQGVVAKPYLRNVFFRICHLTQLGVKLVFVIEGSAPELKWDTMAKRQQTRFPGRPGVKGAGSLKPAGKQKRGNFNACLKECCELLEILGIPYVQSKGEAEALCAVLNMAGLVDGCLTNDGDCFLYGATTVYRNFTMNSKDPHVEMYSMSDIERQLGIDRSGLVALGLLIGCDYVPKGVPGIGVANAVKLLQSLKGRDVIARLRDWREMPESECIDQIEVLARRKALAVPDFPQLKVVDEFMIAADRCPSRLSPWKRPVLPKLQEFALVKMDWTIEYSLEKILPLVTLWDMSDILQSRNPSRHQHLKPHRIVKTRVRQGEPCFEVEWHKPVSDTQHGESFYVTVEPQDVFSKCFPDYVQSFNTAADNKKKNKNKKKKKGKDKSEPVTSLENLSFQLDKLNIGDVTNKLTESVKDLKPDFSTYTETNLTTKAKQPKHLTVSSVTSKPVVNNKSQTSTAKTVVPSFRASPQSDLIHSQKQSVTKCSLPSRSASVTKSVNEMILQDSGQNLWERNEISSNRLGNGALKVDDGKPLLNSEQRNSAACVKPTSSNRTDDRHIPLSERVKLRLQGKPGPALNPRRPSLPYESAKTSDTLPHGSLSGSLYEEELSDMSSLLQEVENLSFKGTGETKTPGKDCLPRVNTKFPITPNICPSKFGRPDFSRNFSTTAKSQQISSPASETFCSPLTFFKESMAKEGHVNVKSSPIPIINADVSMSELGQSPKPVVDTCTSTFESDKKAESKPKTFSSSAEALMSKISSGITNVGKHKEKEIDMSSFSFFDKPKNADPPKKVSMTTSMESPMHRPVAHKIPGMTEHETSRAMPQSANKSQQMNLSQLGLSMSDLGFDSSNASQLGDFQIQTSLLNSMCSSLIQALTPKGVSMNKQEYESLMATLNELDGESDSTKPKTKTAKKLEQRIDKLAEEVVCNIDFSDIEKASTSLKKVRPDVTLEPIRLLGESNNRTEQDEPLSKTAKKRLRRKERQKALEDIAHLNNMAQRLKENNIDPCSLDYDKEMNQSSKTNKDSKKTSGAKENIKQMAENKQSQGPKANQKENVQNKGGKGQGKQCGESKDKKLGRDTKDNELSNLITSNSKATGKQNASSKENGQNQSAKEKQKCNENSTNSKGAIKQKDCSNNASRSQDTKHTSNQKQQQVSSEKDKTSTSVNNAGQKKAKSSASSNVLTNRCSNNLNDSKSNADFQQCLGSSKSRAENANENSKKMNRKERRRSQAENNGSFSDTLNTNKNFSSKEKIKQASGQSVAKCPDSSICNGKESNKQAKSHRKSQMKSDGKSLDGNKSNNKTTVGDGKSKRKYSAEVKDELNYLASAKEEVKPAKENIKQTSNTSCMANSSSMGRECECNGNVHANTPKQESTAVKPKKKKKKKIKKTSPFINLSADGSMNFGATTKVAQYLNNALMGYNMVKTQNSGIQKASPVFELSADEDALLELENLSSLITGDGAKSASSLKKQKLKQSILKNKMQEKLGRQENDRNTGAPVLTSETIVNQDNGVNACDRSLVENGVVGNDQETVQYATFNENNEHVMESGSVKYNTSCLPVFDDILCDDGDDDDDECGDDERTGGGSVDDDDDDDDDMEIESDNVNDNFGRNTCATACDDDGCSDDNIDDDDGVSIDNIDTNDSCNNEEVQENTDWLKNDDNDFDNHDQSNVDSDQSEDETSDDDDNGDDDDIYSDYGMDIVSDDEFNQLREIKIGEPVCVRVPDNVELENQYADYDSFNMQAKDCQINMNQIKTQELKADSHPETRMYDMMKSPMNHNLKDGVHLNGAALGKSNDRENAIRVNGTVGEMGLDIDSCAAVRFKNVAEGNCCEHESIEVVVVDSSSSECDPDSPRSDSPEKIEMNDIEVCTEGIDEHNKDDVYKTDATSSIDCMKENITENGYECCAKNRALDEAELGENPSNGDEVEGGSDSVFTNGFMHDASDSDQNLLEEGRELECYSHGHKKTDLPHSHNSQVVNLNSEFTHENFQHKYHDSEMVSFISESASIGPELKNQNTESTDFTTELVNQISESNNLNGVNDAAVLETTDKHYQTNDSESGLAMNGFHSNQVDNVETFKDEGSKTIKTSVQSSSVDDVKLEAVQSPACLADRLKMKLRKKSTRNVLDSFTRGSLE